MGMPGWVPVDQKGKRAMTCKDILDIDGKVSS
jgi:hypothetical protein